MRTPSTPGHRSAMLLVLAATLTVPGCDTPAPTAAEGTPPASQISKGGPPQFGPWGTPVNLGAPVNTTTGENRPFISAKGDQLFFTSARTTGSCGLNDLWVARRTSLTAPWGDPVNLGPVINTTGDDLAAFLTLDGRQLYFARVGPGCGDADLWLAVRQDPQNDTGWGKAAGLGCTVNSAAKDADPFLVESGSEAGTLYFLSDRDPAGGFDVYRTTFDQKTGTYRAPVPVPELNSPVEEFKIVIRADGLEAFIGSSRSENNRDIWVSTRARDTDPWGPPVNLGPGVNSTAQDAPGSLSYDGTTLYFQSSRTPGGLGSGDIWMVQRQRLN